MRIRPAIIILVAGAAACGTACRNTSTEHLRQGDVALAQGRMEDAVDHYTSASRADRRSADAFFNLGYVLYQQGEFERAADAFIAALALPGEGERASSLYNLGNALARQGKLRDALTAYRSALRLDPRDDDARYNYALVERWLAQEARDDSRARDDDETSGGGLTREAAERSLNDSLSGLRPADRSPGRSGRPDW